MYRVADIMSRNLVTLNEDQDLGLAEAILSLGRFRHLPVVDAEGHLAGLITHRDLLRIWADQGRAAAKTVPAHEVMNEHPVTAKPDMPVFEAAKWMFENKFGCLPVVEKGRLVGIVTEADFLQLAAQLAETAPGPFKESRNERQ